MINSIIRFTVIFIVLVFLQVLLFNNIQFSGYVNPFVYLLFILILPVNIPAWLLLIISFLTGLTIDLFTLSPGMHSFATVMAGFIRPYILRIFAPRDGYEANENPSMAAHGLRWFAGYAAIIVLIHHLTLFYVEVFSFIDFFRTLLRVLLSSVFSLIFIIVLEYYRKGD